MRFERWVFGDETLFQAGPVKGGLVFRQTFEHLPRKIQAGEVWIFLFQFLDDAEAVAVVLESAVAAHELVQDGLALVAERRMAEIVGERDGLGEIGVQPERAGDVARDGGDFHRVGEPRAEMVARAVEKNLRLVFEPAEGARVDDAVTVALVLGAPFGRRLGMFAAARVAAELREGREDLPLDLLQFLSGAGHDECKLQLGS